MKGAILTEKALTHQAWEGAEKDQKRLAR